MTALRLFWWNRKPNFGDRLSKDVVEFVSGRKVEWSSPRDTDLFAVGSLMRFVRRNHNTPREGDKPIIWGTGIITPHRLDFRENVEIASVRGPLTASLMELEDVPMGDPGLLVDMLFEKEPDKNGKIGLVLHHHHSFEPVLRQRLEEDGRFLIIDVKSADHLGVIRDIAACDFVLSSSLHGIIVADAFRVPNTWLVIKGIGNTPAFKFYDYALSVGRIMGPQIPLDRIIAYADQLDFAMPCYFDAVAQRKEAIHASFPKKLMAGA